MNAHHLLSLCNNYYGVDISESSLTECQSQIPSVISERFHPVRIAHKLLERDGLALIQIRYRSWRRGPKSVDYVRNLAQMSSYLIDEFWIECEKAGFEPLFVYLLPTQPELSEHRYAYYALKKRRTG